MGGALYRLGRFAVRRRRSVVVAWLVIAVVTTLAAQVWGGEETDNYRIPGAESQKAIDLLFAKYPDQAGGRAQVVFHLEDGQGRLQDEPFASAVQASLDRLEQVPHVLPDPIVLPSGLLKPDSPVADRTTLVQVVFDLDQNDVGWDSVHAVEDAVQPARDAGIRTEVGGDVVFNLTKPETNVAEGAGVVVAAVILLFAFGSLAGMGLPVGIALFGLATSTALVSFLALVIDVASAAPLLGSMIGMGVGIDYALFIVTRHRQHLLAGMTVEEAAGRANATSGQAVVFAGGTVVIAICGLVLSGVPFVASMGYAAAVIVAVMVLASVTLLPALLGFAGERLAVASLRSVREREARHAERVERLVRLGADAPKTGWERLAQQVSEKPWRFLLTGVAVLLVLTAPVLKMRLGQSDAGTYPESTAVRRTFDLVNEGFGPGFNGPLVLAIDVAAGGADTPEQLQAAIAADRAVAVAAPPDPPPSERGDAAIILVVPKTAPQDEATTDLVHRIRRDIVPSVVEGTGAVAHLGGVTPVYTDLGDRISSRLPIFIGGVVGLSFLLLMAVFRSVLVPLKAAVMNLLSIGASYGIVVAVFQWGWLKDLVGLRETVPIVSVIPMFMFAVLFGLSMDYEVFLLSRVREEYVRTKDNTTSVIVGLASTARVITSAALIMIFVFLGFVAGEDPIIKMMGLGLAIAVLVDATIVRTLLVPASMRLLGDANWWFPAWLDRLLPNLDVEGTAGLPEPVYRDDFVPLGSATRAELERAAAVQLQVLASLERNGAAPTRAVPIPAPAEEVAAKRPARRAGTPKGATGTVRKKSGKSG
jgi:RND superfamily putative drug exporter